MEAIGTGGAWSLGILIGVPAVALLTTATIVAYVQIARRVRYDREELWFARGFLALALGLLFGGLLLAVWPPIPDADYHRYRPVEGAVERVEKRLMADGDGMSERYVVTIGGQPFGVDDTRAALLGEGDEVRLACRKEWQWAAEDGWACRWGGQR